MLYALMYGKPYASLHSEHTGLENELNTVIEFTNWDGIHLYIHKGSLNVQTQENGYKLLMKWYRTPDILHKFIPMI